MWLRHCQRPCPLRRSAPALPKGEPWAKRLKPYGISKASPFGSNNDDRRQWRKQGVAVGAAASRMRARAKQTLGAATRAVSPKVTERASPWRKGCSHSDRQALCQSAVIATWLRHCQQPCPLRRSAPALPKGEPLPKRQSLTEYPKPLPLGEVSPKVTERASQWRKGYSYSDGHRLLLKR